MKLKFLGAAGTVTGSKYLLQHHKSQYLIDCGLFQGMKDLREKNWEDLPIDLNSLDAIILTHAHIDHSGYIPRIVKKGFRGKIYSTPETRDLCRILLPDCAHILEEDAKYANKKGYSKHHPALPLFTVEEAVESLKYFRTVDYRNSFSLGDDLSFEFLNAGHILGAASVKFTNAKDHMTVAFSGDIGRIGDPILFPPTPLGKVDYLVMESTYGDRNHLVSDPSGQLEAIIHRTFKRKGTILVPAFTVGRTQSLLYYLAQLKQSRAIPNIPIYVNSPMATSATDLYREHHRNHKLSAQECNSVFGIAQYVSTTDESKALNLNRDPKIIISASGMAAGGRVLHHLKSFAPDPKNTILFSGFQAAGTRGEAIVHGAQFVKIHGELVSIRAEVVNLENLSAHADQAELIEWCNGIKGPPKKVFVTHGERQSAVVLSTLLESKFGWKCHVPHYADEAELEV